MAAPPAALRLKLTHKHKDGPKSHVVTLPPATTIAELCSLFASTFSLPSADLTLLTGFPPAPLLAQPSALLAGTLATGTTVEARVNLPPPALEMARITVAGDGNCLFASVGFIVQGVHTPEAATRERESVAAALLSDPEAYTEAVLGRAPGEYLEMISRQGTWGGAIELSVLSKLHQLEVRLRVGRACGLGPLRWIEIHLRGAQRQSPVSGHDSRRATFCASPGPHPSLPPPPPRPARQFHAIEVRSGHVYRFGEGAGYARIGFLFYNGLHYDPVAGAAAPHPRTFPREGPEQAAASAGALALAAAARAAGTYTDLAGFTLRCSECGVGVTGQAGAVRHAQDSGGHNQFFEYRAAPVQVA